MRISTSMMFKNYTGILEDKMGDVQKYSDQVASGMKFARASDDPVSAMQTLESCHEYVRNEQYQESATSTGSWLQATETTLGELTDTLKTVQEKLTEASNGTNSSSDGSNNATELSQLQQQLMTTLNSTYSGRYIFGQGTDQSAPFTLISGQLAYFDYTGKNGADYQLVSDLVNPATATSGQSTISGATLSNAIDLGLGLKISASGQMLPGTYFEAATSGLNAMVAGYTASGQAFNVVDALTTTISKLQSGDNSAAASCLSTVSKAEDAVSNVTVSIGEKSNMLTFVSNTLTANKTNIVTRLSDAMDVDSATASMNYTMSMTVYKASLSVTSSALQESLIDFLK